MTSRNRAALDKMLGASKVSRRSVAERTGDEVEATMAEVFADDVEVHEPGCMPYGGVHKGRDTWFAVRREMLAKRAASPWQQELNVQHIWEIPEDDVIIMHYLMEWTDKRTGRSFSQPSLEILTFDEGKIVKTELFPQDSHALLDTLE